MRNIFITNSLKISCSKYNFKFTVQYRRKLLSRTLTITKNHISKNPLYLQFNIKQYQLLRNVNGNHVHRLIKSNYEKRHFFRNTSSDNSERIFDVIVYILEARLNNFSDIGLFDI